jgi:hypothetical protein
MSQELAAAAIADTKLQLAFPALHGILNEIEGSSTQINKMLLTAKLLEGVAKHPRIFEKNPHLHEPLRAKMDELFTFAYAKRANTNASIVDAANMLMSAVAAVQVLL